MMKSILALIVLLFSIGIAFAQDRELVRISGVILNAENREPLPFVHIIDRNKRSGATSEPDGTFNLQIPKNDTIYFSSVGFKTTYISFGDSSRNRYESLTILMQPQTITLKPVEINAYNLEKILNKGKTREFSLEQKKPKPLFEEKEKVEKPAIGVGVVPGGGAALEGAITAFANLFNNEFKQRKKLRQIIERESEANMVREFEKQLIKNYDDIAKKVTGLDKEEFRLFSELYRPAPGFLLAADDYDLTLRILEDFREFKYKYKYQEVSLDELMENAKFRK